MVKDKIEDIDISDTALNAFLEYSAYVVRSRAIPDVRDGLKPVQRKCLYSIWLKHRDNHLNKTARIVGDVMGDFHPHGDSGIVTALMTMSHEWKLNQPMIYVHGNNGTIDGDPAASMRYTELRLTKYSQECLVNNLDVKGMVTMRDNFDGRLKQPTVLPVRVPNLLINGADGIASGYATSIPTFNFNETLKASQRLLHDPNISDEELLSIIPAPDFSLGGVILVDKATNKALLTGHGKFSVRASYRVNKKNKHYNEIIFNTVPYNINKKREVSRLKSLVAERDFPAILEVEDESDRHGIAISVKVAKDLPIDEALGYVFSKTRLKTTVSMNSVVIDDGKPKVLGVRDILIKFNAFRLELLQHFLKAKLADSNKRLELYAGYLKLSSKLAYYIKLLKDSESKADAVSTLIANGFTQYQADNIAGMPLYRASRLDHDKLAKKYNEELNSNNKNLKLLIADKGLQVKALDADYENLMKEYGSKRKTRIIHRETDWSYSKETQIEDVDMAVSVTKAGYIKVASTKSYQASYDEGDANSGVEVAPTDQVVYTGIVNRRSGILLITAKGKYAYILVDKLPLTKWKDMGKNLAQLGSDFANDAITGVVSAYDPDTHQDLPNYQLLYVRSGGRVIRIAYDKFIRQRGFMRFLSFGLPSQERILALWGILSTSKGKLIAEVDKGKERVVDLSKSTCKVSIKTQGSKLIRCKERVDSVKLVLDDLSKPNKVVEPDSKDGLVEG